MTNDPFDCQEFHELCMDYRAAPTRLGSILPQVAYERLQAYCRAAIQPERPLTFPKIDASALPEPKHPFEPFELTERS